MRVSEIWDSREQLQAFGFETTVLPVARIELLVTLGEAAFVGPLRPGAHTVEIRLKATGDAFREEPVSQYFPDGLFEFSVVYEVLVH